MSNNLGYSIPGQIHNSYPCNNSPVQYNQVAQPSSHVNTVDLNDIKTVKDSIETIKKDINHLKDNKIDIDQFNKYINENETRMSNNATFMGLVNKVDKLEQGLEHISNALSNIITELEPCEDIYTKVNGENTESTKEIE